MKVLVVTPMQPSGPGGERQGITHRMAVFLRALSAVAGQLTIAHIVPPDAPVFAEAPDARDARQSAFWGCELRVELVPRRAPAQGFRAHYLDGLLHAAEQPMFTSFAGPEQAEAVGRLLDTGPDLVFVHCLAAMCAVLRSRRRPRRVVFDVGDLDHVVRLRYALSPPRWPGKLAYAAHVPALLAAEARGIRLAERSFVCSAHDQALLARLGLGRKVTVVPNAVDVPPDPPALPAAPVLLFLGACDYPPNAEAAERLATRIMPLVRRAVPDAMALIAGKASDTLPSRARAPEGVAYLGFVPDLDALYARSRLVVCPLTIGGGTRLKLIEAAGYARPMVSTAMGAEGLDFAEGREILLRDDDEGFAAACVAMLRDDAAAAALGAAARRAMVARYDASHVAARLAGLLRAGTAAAREASAWPR